MKQGKSDFGAPLSPESTGQQLPQANPAGEEEKGIEVGGGSGCISGEEVPRVRRGKESCLLQGLRKVPSSYCHTVVCQIGD